MGHIRRSALLASCSIAATIMPMSVFAEELPESAFGSVEIADQPDTEQTRITVTGERVRSTGATKTNAPAVEVPQPVTVVPAELSEAQGAISISDTVNYVAGVQSNPYGPDSRVDGGLIRGVSGQQFRDGMRDIYSYYASIRADPYNFSQIEVLRGPSSVLFGQGGLGGIFNLVSKTPDFTPRGEVSVRYGSFDRKEALADITAPLGNTVAARLVARVRDADTQTDYVPDDRVMLSPSISWSPGVDTQLTLLGLYQEDDGGSTSQFLPVVGTLLPNPNGRLPSDRFIGKPGWDLYDGRLLQSTALLEQRLTDRITLNLKGRYIDSDLTYFTHYPNSYANPENPFLDEEQRLIGLYADGSVARMEIFSTDNTLQAVVNTGPDIEHTLLAGVDYSWNRVRKEGGFGFETIDIYHPDYGALSDFGGGLPQPSGPSEDVEQSQLGFYLQDHVRFADTVSLVLAARRDEVTTDSFGTRSVDTGAWTFRAGVIAQVLPGVSPFASYSESFEPIAGTASDGEPFVPKSGRQFEVGLKFHPNPATMVTATAYHIKETGRPVSDDATADPTDLIQAGESFSRGFELQASTILPGGLNALANVSYNEAEIEGTGIQIDNVPKFNASAWLSKPVELGRGITLVPAAGVRHSGKSTSYGAAFPDGLVTPSYTLVDASVSLDWQNWGLRVNATNLLGTDYYSACLARGDCFQGSERNFFATLTRRF